VRSKPLLDLKVLQENFQHFLLAKNPSILAEIIDVPPVPATIRLEIYEDAYYLRLLESLQSDYEVFYALVGEETFDLMGRAYIQAFPSTFRSVRWFGKEFAAFLRASDFLTKKPWLIEMAEFEWALTQVFDGENFSGVTVEEMAVIPFEAWPNLRFILRPIFTLLMFEWNTPAIWSAFKEKQKIIKPKKAKLTWMLWRKTFEVQFASLQPDEKAMLIAMQQQETFGAICEKLCEWIPGEQVALHAAQLLKRFILDQLLSEIKIL
jgi:hypothetical protein